MTRTLFYSLLALFSGLIFAAGAFAYDAKPLFSLSYDDVEKAIGQALIEKNVGETLSVSMNGHKEEAVFSHTAPITPDIRSLTYDKVTRHWSANILAVAENGDIVSAIPAAGRFEEMAEVPVLKRSVRYGETINESDVEMQHFPLARTRSDTVKDAAGLIGKTPVRTISQLRPIRSHEVTEPAVIKKDSIVRIRYYTPGMEITTTGQAMEDGPKGGIINVRNLASKKIIRATIEDESTVNVIPVKAEVSANAAPEREDAYATN